MRTRLVSIFSLLGIFNNKNTKAYCNLATKYWVWPPNINGLLVQTCFSRWPPSTLEKRLLDFQPVWASSEDLTITTLVKTPLQVPTCHSHITLTLNTSKSTGRKQWLVFTESILGSPQIPFCRWKNKYRLMESQYPKLRINHSPGPGTGFIPLPHHGRVASDTKTSQFPRPF